MLKHGVMLRLWLGHTADPDRLRATLENQRDLSEKMRVRAAADPDGAAEEPGWALPELVLRWSERYYADERDRADQMLAELDEASHRVTERQAGSVPPGVRPGGASGRGRAPRQ